MRILQTFDEESCICDAAFVTAGKNTSTYSAGRRSTFFKVTHKVFESITTSAPCLFRKIPMFSMIAEPDNLFKYCSTKKFKEGHQISQLGDSFYYVVVGSVNTCIKELKAGAYFGHEQLLAGTGIVEADMVVSSPTLLFILSSEGFNDPLFAEAREDLLRVVKATASDTDQAASSLRKASSKKTKLMKKNKTQIMDQSLNSGADGDVSSSDTQRTNVGGGPWNRSDSATSLGMPWVRSDSAISLGMTWVRSDSAISLSMPWDEKDVSVNGVSDPVATLTNPEDTMVSGNNFWWDIPEFNIADQFNSLFTAPTATPSSGFGGLGGFMMPGGEQKEKLSFYVDRSKDKKSKSKKRAN